MRIKSLELKNFKRFTDLTISDIPETAKLVLLIGSNGSGKSSMFDAFEVANTASKANSSPVSTDQYYTKNNNSILSVHIKFKDGNEFNLAKFTPTDNGNPFGQNSGITKENLDIEGKKNLFYGRSSYRQVPKLTRTQSGLGSTSDFETDGDRPKSMIDRDDRFENDIEIVSAQIFTEIFSDPSLAPEIIGRYINPLNSAFEKIFGSSSETSLKIIEIIQPLNNQIAKITFKKGVSEFHYNYLSAGEKEIFNIMFNLLVRKDKYQDTIYFIDEMDVHLNTQLQYNLIKEITENWIPENSQLWTASHSLGFIEYANESENAAIFDFDDLNFDVKQELYPKSKELSDVYEVAIPKNTITKVLKNYKLVVVENKNAVYFNAALGEKGFLFLPANNNREVFLTIKGDSKKLGLRDRDYLRDDEIESIIEAVPNLKILKYYTFENYLYHPDNLAELNLSGFNRDEYIAEITRQKKEKLIDIASEIATSRQTYVEFKEGIRNDGEIKPITNALQSEDFEMFYTFYNMKNHFNANYLKQFKYTLSQLATTEWFKNEILSLLKDNHKTKKIKHK